MTATKKAAAKKAPAKKAAASAPDPLEDIRADTPDPELTDLDRDPGTVCTRCGRDGDDYDGRILCPKHAARAGLA